MRGKPRGRNSGASRCGPRRLTKSTCMPPAAGRSPRRRGAGEASWAAASGRSMKNRVSPLCAARCRRRRLSPRAWLAQNSSAPQLPLRSTCSAAHSASALRLVRSHSSREGGRPSAASARAWGGWGGCSRTMRRSAQACRAGRSRRISPMPGCCCSSSTRVPTGQPPPGNWEESAACPVSTQRVPERASCEARQSEGCKASGAIGGSAKGEAPAVGEQFIWVGKKVLYKRTVLAEPGFGKMYSFRPYQLSDWY